MNATSELITQSTPALFGVLPFYGMLVLLGGLLAFGWAYIEWNRKGYRTWDYLFLCSWVFLFAIYGAKVWYIIFDPTNAFGNVNDVLDVLIIIFIPAFGRSIMGTIVFVPIGIWLWQRYWGSEYRTLDMMDIILPAFFIGQAIGRWGNFVNAEVFGNIVNEESLYWLPEFIKKGMNITIDGGNTYHYYSPLFFYESIIDMLGFVVIIVLFKSNSYFKEGSAGYFYLIYYSLARIILEPLRYDEFKMYWGVIETTVMMSSLLFVVSTTLFIDLQLRSKNIHMFRFLYRKDI